MQGANICIFSNLFEILEFLAASQILPVFDLVSLQFCLVLFPFCHIVPNLSWLRKANKVSFFWQSLRIWRVRIAFSPTTLFCCVPFCHSSKITNNVAASEAKRNSRIEMFVHISIPWRFAIVLYNLFLSFGKNAIIFCSLIVSTYF